MKVIHLTEQNSILSSYLKDLRSVDLQHDSLRFRRSIERIGEVMAYEISRTLTYRTEQVQTPLGVAPMQLIADPIVLGTILRAGLPLHNGLLNSFDKAENAFVSAYRKYIDEKTFEVDIEYIASPSLDGKTLIIADPMLATGSSMELAYKALLTKGTPRQVHLACVLGTPQAIDYLEKTMPQDTTLWVAAIDPVLNEHSYIVPGLGDAGDLAFGEKI